MKTFFESALRSRPDWRALTAAIKKEASKLQAECAEAVLAQQRTRYANEPPANQSTLVRSVLRALNRRAKEADPFPSLGVPEAGDTVPSSFHHWIDARPAKPCRPTPSLQSEEGPLNYSKLWRLGRVPGDGVVVFSRAADTIRNWRKAKRENLTGLPPVAKLTPLVHTKILPTAMAQRADHYWLTGQKRYMSVLESAGPSGCGTRHRSRLHSHG